MTANTVISQDNACIETMQTDQVGSISSYVLFLPYITFFHKAKVYFKFYLQLLDLFVLQDQKNDRHEKKEDVGSIVGAYKNVLENLPELWEDKLYEEEYDLSTFIKNLGK